MRSFLGLSSPRETKIFILVGFARCEGGREAKRERARMWAVHWLQALDKMVVLVSPRAYDARGGSMRAMCREEWLYALENP